VVWHSSLIYHIYSHTIQRGLTLKLDLSHIQSYNTTWFDTQAWFITYTVIQYNMVWHSSLIYHIYSLTIQRGLTLKLDLSHIQSYNTTWFDTQAWFITYTVKEFLKIKEICLKNHKLLVVIHISSLHIDF